MATKWEVRPEDDGWFGVYENFLCHERFSSREKAEAGMKMYKEDDEATQFISAQVDTILDTVKEKYPNIKDVRSRIVGIAAGWRAYVTSKN